MISETGLLWISPPRPTGLYSGLRPDRCRAHDGRRLEARHITEAHPAAARVGYLAPNHRVETADLWVVALAMVLSTCVLSAERRGTETVVLKPGQNIQEIVENSPEGVRFRLEFGIYRQQTIYPKDRQEFLGEGSVILSGATELDKWTKEAGFWRADGLPVPLPLHGECAAGRDLCTHREDLFFNGRLYERVKSLDDLDASKWYYEKRRAYLADDPTGQLVELGVTPLAFGGKAEDVLLRDLVVEKYASDAQSGAIFADEARGWRIVNVTARWNHGAGLSFGPETLVQGGLFSHNGQIGIVGIGEPLELTVWRSHSTTMPATIPCGRRVARNSGKRRTSSS